MKRGCGGLVVVAAAAAARMSRSGGGGARFARTAVYTHRSSGSIVGGTGSRLGSARYFTRYIKSNEPEPGVETEFDVEDASEYKLPYVREWMKEEMWELHKGDPQRWTWNALSQKYKMAIERVRAIIILMEKRENHMKKNKVFKISSTWSSIWKMHLEGVHTPEAIAEAIGVEPAEVTTCIANMKEHELRQRLLDDMSEM
jgi:hypothetical protein